MKTLIIGSHRDLKQFLKNSMAKNEIPSGITEMFISGIQNDIEMIDFSTECLVGKVKSLQSLKRTKYLNEPVFTEDLAHHFKRIETKLAKLNLELADNARDRSSLCYDAPMYESKLRLGIVNLMVMTLQYWTQYISECKLELARQSGLWTVYESKGRVNTRALDKYLNINTLPKSPRINTVLRTAYYVLRYDHSTNEAKRKLEASIQALQNIIKTEALSKN